MLLMRLSSAASSGSIFSFSGVGVLAFFDWRCEGNGALPVTPAFDVSEGGTDGLAGADNARLE